MDPHGRTGPGPKVFGIGLSRTGTKSLAGALNLLGIRTKWYPQDPQTYRELLMGEYRLSILKTYQAKRWGQTLFFVFIGRPVAKFGRRFATNTKNKV